MRFRGILLFCLFLSLSILLMACGKSEKENKTDGNGENAETVKLVMYSWRPEDRPMYEKAIAAFQDKHPNITIEFQPYKSTEYNTILTNALVSGTGPDIIQLRPYSGATTIADNDYLLPLDDVSGLADFNEQYLDAARGSDGKVYGVPLSLNSGVIFYNKTIFEKYGLEEPTTYEEFIEVCEKLKKEGIVPIAQSGRAAYLLSMTHAVIAPSAYGGNTFVDSGMDLTDPSFIESVERMQEMAAYFPEDFIAIEDDAAQAMLYTEQAAMYINGDYRLATFESTAPELEIGVIPGLAEEPGGTPMVTTWVDGSYAAVKSSKHPEEALLFMEFLGSKEFGELFSNEVNRISAVPGVVPEHPIVKEISAASEASATPYLMLVHYGEGEPTTKTVFENALQGMYLEEITIDDVIQEAVKNAERAGTEN
jgi:raffinose/stachyose/melibiose transport system substrate-binding protein